MPATVASPPDPWKETEEEFGARLKVAAGWVNHHHDVEGLCKEMPQRMHDFVDHPSKTDINLLPSSTAKLHTSALHIPCYIP